MGGGVGGVRVGRAVGGALASGWLAFGTAAESPLFVVLLESGTAGATGMASV